MANVLILYSPQAPKDWSVPKAEQKRVFVKFKKPVVYMWVCATSHKEYELLHPDYKASTRTCSAAILTSTVTVTSLEVTVENPTETFDAAKTSDCSLHRIPSLEIHCDDEVLILDRSSSGENKQLTMLPTLPKAKLKGCCINLKGTARLDFIGWLEQRAVCECSMASTAPRENLLDSVMIRGECTRALLVGQDSITMPKCRLYNERSVSLEAVSVSSDNKFAVLLRRAIYSSGPNISQHVDHSMHLLLCIFSISKANTKSERQKIAVDVHSMSGVPWNMHWNLKEYLSNLQNDSCLSTCNKICYKICKELPGLLLTGSYHNKQSKGQYGFPCEETSAVVPDSNADTERATTISEPCCGSSLLADASHYCRVEPITDSFSIEVDDTDGLQEYFDVPRAERRHNEVAEILHKEDATPTLLFGTSRNCEVGSLERETENHEFKETHVASEYKCGFKFNGCTRDRKPIDLLLYPESFHLNGQTANVVAYPVYSVRASVLQQLTIASHVSNPDIELFRLASLVTWPHLGKLPALRCCTAGFSRPTTGGADASAGDELACVSCGCSVSRWTPGVDPLALHYDKCGRHCSFIAGLPRSRAPLSGLEFYAMHVADSPAANRAVATVPSMASCTKSNAMQSQSASDWLSSIGLVPLTRNSAEALDAYRPATMAVAACGSALVKQPRATSSSLEAPRRSDGSTPVQGDELAKSESFRLRTFADVWAPYDRIVDARELAKNGFRYAGPGDRVQCVFCLGLLRNWEPGDRVDEQHAQHFTYCRFVQGHEVGNVPIPFWPLETKRSSDLQSSADATDGRGAELGINHAVPKISDFAVEARRLLSFATWPTNHHMQPETLAKAGFFYLGKEDAVQCFFCEGTVADWRTHCDPWVEHAQRFPDCSFLLQVQGHDFVSRNRVDGGQAASRTQTTTRLAVDPREVRARIDSSKARILLRMDYPLDLVREVIQLRLATSGSDHETSEQLLGEIFQTHDEKQRASAAQNASSCRLTRAAEPLFSCHQRWEAGTKQQHESRLAAATATVPCAVAASAPAASGANGPLADICTHLTAHRVPLGANLRSGEENRQLKTQLTCKVCMDALVGIVFLPCGHLVCCAECAPALKACPICRVCIRGTVRTVM